MRNFATYLSYLPKRLTIALIAILVIAFPVLMVQAGDSDGPKFNIYDNTYVDGQYIGDESNFLRAGPVNDNFDVVNVYDPHSVCEGQADLWVYIHNGQTPGFNGDNYDGPGVAHDTRVKIGIPGVTAPTLTANALISASNADSEYDTVTINCGTHEIEMSYVPGTARGYSEARGNFAISDDIVSANGVPIGSFADDGEVPGCWEYRVWVKITVDIEKYEEPEPVVSCDALNSIFVDRDTRQLQAEASVENASVVSYDFDFGDGATETITTNALTATTGNHDYQPGNYTATVTINFDTNNDGQADTHKTCQTPVEVEEEPPEPIYTCDALSMSLIGENEYEFVAAATAENGATIENYAFYVNDAEMQSSDAFIYVLQESTPGTYVVRVDVTFDVNGETIVVPGTGECQKTLEIEEEPPEPIDTCDALSFIELEDKFEFTVSATALHGATITE
ncbi:MAG: PKD domain-containing protein, partial [Candidatus Saccharimonadales bacterium]|nr:PKD domain-containing protein [Candidatus Saccharimonadales bacterium]